MSIGEPTGKPAINLAHGSLFALGAYFAYAIATPRLPLPPDLLQSWAAVPLGWRFTAAMLLAPILVAPFGVVLERLMRRTYGRDPLYGLLLTFGVAMVIEELIRIVWGTRDYTLPVPRGISGGFMMLDLIWSTYRFWAAGFAIVAMAIVWLVIERTRFGALVKAGAHDSEIVQALGHDLERLRVWVFVLGTMMAAVAGVILAPVWGIRPHMGVDAVIPAFVIIVLGGVGSFWGAVLGGILVGMVVGGRRCGGVGGWRDRRGLHLPPPRHLLLTAHHRFWPGLLVHRHQIARHHRR